MLFRSPTGILPPIDNIYRYYTIFYVGKNLWNQDIWGALVFDGMTIAYDPRPISTDLYYGAIVNISYTYDVNYIAYTFNTSSSEEWMYPNANTLSKQPTTQNGVYCSANQLVSNFALHDTDGSSRYNPIGFMPIKLQKAQLI